MANSIITAVELFNAKLLWIREVQQDLINDVKTFETLKKQLKLFCDTNGLWRCGGGRIDNADLKYDTKYPYILQKSKFAELLINVDFRLVLIWIGFLYDDNLF